MNPVKFRLIASLVLTALSALLGLVLLDPTWQPGDAFLRHSYDWLHTFGGRHSLADSEVVIVYLDLQSFQQENRDPSQPWPRELHARLLDRLSLVGARAVVFDIIFSAAGRDPAEDETFAQSIRANGRVVLAGEYNEDASHAPDDTHEWARFHMIVPPHEPFAQAAAAWGIAEQRIDDDSVVRRHLAGFPSSPQSTLSWAAATFLKVPQTQSASAMQSANERWIRYYGPAMSIPHTSLGQALDAGGVPDNFFHDKVVLVGARPWVAQLHEHKDEFRSPYHSWTFGELFMPGVEVHATELLNVIRGDWLRRLAPGGEMALLVLTALLFGGGFIWLRPVPATVAAFVGAGAALGLSHVAFSQGVWFPWLVVVAAQIPCALGGSVLFHSVEWYRTRRRYEARIREQAALIDKANDAILVQDLAGKILYVNPSVERLYGWSADELLRIGAAEMFSPDAAAAKSARAAALNDGEWNGELRQQTKSGRIVIVASRWTLIRDAAGRPKELLLINSDVTDQKELEAQFLRTQRMNTIGTLAGGMAHDLNNALAPILMGTQLLRRKAADDETRELLSLMETNTHRSADMVRQVLLFARGRGGEFERLELGPLIKELEKLVRETFPKNIAVETFLPGDLWPVRGNLTQLHQVLLNLCVNARDAMPDGGRLCFVADNVEFTDADVAADVRRRTEKIANKVRLLTSAATEHSEIKPGAYVSLLVSDTGTGIPPEVRAKIFEPFFTTKGEGRGTGIGLSTVARIVKAHGGFLRVESEPGQGTSFEAFLPRAPEGMGAAPVVSMVELPRGCGELLLVADDERAMRELIAAELTAFGYRVLTAANGAEAVALFKERATEVCLLITDNAMPVMDGRAAITELRRLQPSLPVIFISSEAEAETPEGAKALSKPFALEELLGAVGGLLRPEEKRP